MAMVIRRRIVPDGAFEPIFASVGDGVAIGRLVRETNTIGVRH
jgi:hypothetical protein